MIGSAFRYERPASLDEALELLNQHGDAAAVLAGGQELVPRLNLGGASPDVIVDIGRIDGLNRVRALDGLISIGARTSHTELGEATEVRDQIGLLAAAAAEIGGGPQVRNRGTIGGAIAADNPVYDYPACLLVLDATVHLARRDEHRAVSFDELIAGNGGSRRGDELLTEVSISAPPRGHRFVYEKLTFSAGCYLIAGVVCIVESIDDGVLGGVRVAIGGVSARAQRLRDVERLLEGETLGEALLDEAAAVTRVTVAEPITDSLADGAYRRRVSGALVKRALGSAATAEGGVA